MLPDMPKPKAVDFTVIEDSEQKEPIRFEPISDEQYQSMMKEATSQKQLNQLTQKARPDGSIETETSTVSSKEMSDILDK